jgi:hypothetical protein
MGATMLKCCAHGTKIRGIGEMLRRIICSFVLFGAGGGDPRIGRMSNGGVRGSCTSDSLIVSYGMLCAEDVLSVQIQFLYIM